MKILLAVDDSKHSEAAAQAVLAQGLPQDTEVTVLHVVEPMPLLVAREMAAYEPKLEAARRAQLDEAEALVGRTAERLRSKGWKVTTAVKEGDPKSEIIDLASSWHADLIVMGSHGKKGINRFLLGSVSDAVVRHAHCSVELVRLPSRG
jgi:nucleotide-binding universal stress UspA family protein